MPKPAQVVVVGSIMQDLTLECGAFPRAGQTIVGRMRTGLGGKGSNQAIACGRLGVPTLFIGAMGRGAFAAEVQAVYRKERIGCRLALKAGCPTGTAVILVNREGENEIVIDPGANARLSSADIPRSLWRGARVAIVQLEASPAATAHALRAARAAGVLTLLNPAPMRDDFDPGLLAHADILIPNESEFVALVRRLPQAQRPGFSEAALRALRPGELHELCRRLGVPTVIVTLGDKGCFVSEAHGHRALPAHRNVKVVDTTGAGDAFCGGLAAGLVRTGGDIIEAAKLGTAVAALSITKPGAAPAMPTRRELDRFLRNGK